MKNLPSVPTATRVDASTSFSGMAIQKVRSGHLQSPWFSFAGSETVNHRNFTVSDDEHQFSADDMTTGQTTYEALRAAGLSAFAQATGQSQFDCFVSEKIDPIDGSRWWCFCTRFPCDIPVPKKKKGRLNPAWVEAGKGLKDGTTIEIPAAQPSAVIDCGPFKRILATKPVDPYRGLPVIVTKPAGKKPRGFWRRQLDRLLWK
jgi:hypothetical protein